MNKKNIDTFIDFGSSMIRLGVFNENLTRNKYLFEKKLSSDFNIEKINIQKLNKTLQDIIQNTEKNLNFHIKNINLMLDTSNLHSIDISIKKNFEGKNISTQDIKYLLQETSQIVQKYNLNKKIIHIIVKKFIFDEDIFVEIPNENLKCNNLTLEIKFICIPNDIFNNVTEIFKNNDIEIDNFSCSSYVKSLYYKKFFNNYEKKFFLDIGYNKTSIAVFDKNVLTHLSSIPIGGNNITKDISKIFKLKLENSEEIKKKLSTVETTFSENDNEMENLKENLIENNNNVSLDLLIKVIHARIEEIINLSFKNISFLDTIKENSYILVFTGNGSKILNNNAIYLEKNFSFIKEMNFYEESLDSICKSMQHFNLNDNMNEVSQIPKKQKNKGFFEKLFDFFN